MKARRPLLAVCLGSSIVAGCTLDDGTGTPDPAPYWEWECPEGGTPLDASNPIDYVASGTCGAGGPFTLSVDGCEMFGSWSVLGLSDVQTTRYTSSPGLGGWTIAAIGSVLDAGGGDGAPGEAGSGPSWNCTAEPAPGGDLTFTCFDAATSETTCQSTLATAGGS